jgi:hypothetical protein
MKLKFGFSKVRYRGLLKNANRLFATCALVNLFRKKLLGAVASQGCKGCSVLRHRVGRRIQCPDILHEISEAV